MTTDGEPSSAPHESAARRPTRPGAFWLAVITVIMGAWLGVAFLAVPWLIGRGYAGESFDAINRIFSGRDVHAVEFYLGTWRRAAVYMTAALWLVLAIVPFRNRIGVRRRTVLDRIVGGPAGLKPGAVLQLAFGSGLAGGLLEAAYLAVRQIVVHQPASDFHIELLWMAPLSAALASVCVGALLTALALAGKGEVGLRKAVFLFGFLALHSLVQSLEVGIHPAAEAVLSLGITSVLSGKLVARWDRLAGWSRPARAVLVGMVVIIGGFGYLTLPRVMERLAQRGLPAAAGDRPNILLIIIDTARQANFSLYGYRRPTSPNIDAWASEGTVFDRAIATSSWTLPTHGSLFTGEYNHVLRTGAYSPLGGEFRTIAEVLAEGGYATAGFAANPAYTTGMSGLAQGFAYYDDRKVDLPHFLRSAWLSRLILGSPLSEISSRFTPERYQSAAEITDGFLEWLEHRDPDRPFFAFLNYFDAHEPYVTPSPWPRRFGPVSSQGWGQFWSGYRPAPDADSGSNADELALWVNRYDAAIAYVDHHIGLLRQRLETAGLSDSTIVIVTSDHGEMWGEQGEIGHGRSLYLPSVHVPLALMYPSRIPAGMRVETPVSLRDIPSTLGELAGVTDLAGFHGESLVPLWQEGDPPPHPAPLVELEPFGTAPGPWWAPVQRGPMKSLILGDLQYIVAGDGSEQLFNIESDPGQRENLVGRASSAASLEQFRAIIDSIFQGSRDN